MYSGKVATYEAKVEIEEFNFGLELRYAVLSTVWKSPLR